MLISAAAIPRMSSGAFRPLARMDAPRSKGRGPLGRYFCLHPATIFRPTALWHIRSGRPVHTEVRPMRTVTCLASLVAAIACIINGQSVVRVSHSMPDAPVSETSPAFPSFMFEGLRSGEMRRFPSPVPLPAGWQNVISEAGVIDVEHIPQPYRAMRFHVVRNDPRNNPQVNMRLGCISDEVGEQSTDAGYCPNDDQIPRSKYVKAFRLELYGPDAGQFGLSYHCWSARQGDGEHLLDHGDKVQANGADLTSRVTGSRGLS